MANNPEKWQGDAVLPELKAALAKRDAYPAVPALVEMEGYRL